MIYVRGDCTAGLPESTRGLSVDEIRENFCLACQTYLSGDCEFVIPVESRIDAPKILPGMCSSETPIAPSIMKYRTRYEPAVVPLTGSQRSLRLDGYTGKRPRIIPGQHQRLISANSPYTATVSCSTGYPEVIAIEPGDTTSATYGLAVDLGTTTVVGMLFNLAGMQFCAQASNLNRQITYGEELVTRATHPKAMITLAMTNTMYPLVARTRAIAATSNTLKLTTLLIMPCFSPDRNVTQSRH